jgi:hypothetical protein
MTVKPTTWPNSIEATVGVNGPFNEMPRLPFQVGNCAVRAFNFLVRFYRLKYRAESSAAFR